VSDNVFNELRTIRSRIESIERTQEVLVRAEADRILASILPRFREDLVLGQVYLLVDGIRGQRQITTAMSQAGMTGASEATVSRKLEALRDLDVIELVDRTAAGKIYAKTQVDRLLHLSRQVERIVQGEAKRR
jgi:Fic family protein